MSTQVGKNFGMYSWKTTSNLQLISFVIPFLNRVANRTSVRDKRQPQGNLFKPVNCSPSQTANS